MKYAIFGFVLSALLSAFPYPVRGETYYVDHEAGDDAQTGTTMASAWRHAPGDPQAAGAAAKVQLQPGDTVQFKAGVVYRGSVEIPADGTPGKPIRYRGTGWGEGRAVLDGSERIPDWRKVESPEMAAGNPHFRHFYWTEIEADSPFLLNLHEAATDGGADEFLWMAQDPNPKNGFFYDRTDSFYPVAVENLRTTSLRAPEVFTEKDPRGYDHAFLLLWGNPNQTIRVPLTGYDPASGTVSFPDVTPRFIYGNREQFFALYNHPRAIDRPGEFSVGPANAEGKRRILLWPRSGTEPGDRITRSVRSRAVDLGLRSHVVIEGFEIRKYAGAGKTDGIGIHTARGLNRDLLIRDNHITHMMTGSKGGYGGIYLNGVADSVVEDNEISRVLNHRGLFLSGGCENVIVRRNRISYPGATALGVYSGKRIQILENRISQVYATHANAITLYIACENVLVAGNLVTDASNPITFQDSGPLYFIGNYTDGQHKFKNVNEWGNTSRGPWASGEIVFLHNTFVNADKNLSLSLGKDPEKTYVVANNILDGLGMPVEEDGELTRTGNFYTGLNSFQAERYGWTLEPGAKFAEGEGVPAQIHPGVDVEKFLPVKRFPDIDFSRYLRDAAGAKAPTE